eukprot:jgi/Pico_ML_1/54445/g4791.t1
MKPSCADSYASDDGRRTQANRHGFAAVLTHLVEEGSKVAGTHVNDWKSRLVALGQRVEKTLSLHELYQEKSEETLGALLAELKDLQKFRKDVHGKRAIHVMLSQRTKLLKYLRRKDPEKYFTTIAKLGLKDRPFSEPKYPSKK